MVRTRCGATGTRSVLGAPGAPLLVRAPTLISQQGLLRSAVMQLVWARCELSRVREPQREALQCCACRNAASTQRAAFRARILSKDLGFRNAQGA